MDLTPDQKNVVNTIRSWYHNSFDQHMSFGALAGTGKTYLVSKLSEHLPDIKILYCAPTGKAASVLRSKIARNENVIGPMTLHSLLYQPMDIHFCGCGECKSQLGNNAVVEGKCKKPQLDVHEYPITDTIFMSKYVKDAADLIVVDEASMIPTPVWKDLLNTECRILAVGDHGQLPPVGQDPKILQYPDATLTEILRQASDDPAGRAILDIAYAAREGRRINFGIYAPGVSKQRRATAILGDISEDCVFLCGFRKTRLGLNQSLRAAFGRSGDLPQPGDRVICKRNNPKYRIFNGMIGTVVSAVPARFDTANCVIQTDSGYEFDGAVWLPGFNTIEQTQSRVPGTLWDYAYAITTHSAQGSEWDQVIVEDEAFGSREDKQRWRYTAYTRSKKSLTILDA